MANMDNGHNDAIFCEKDVKELSENLSRVFCNFVNTKIGDSHMLKKYIDNYKALLHLPIFAEMQSEIERLKEHLQNDDSEEHIKLEVEETGECDVLPTEPPSDEEDQEEVVTDDGGDVPHDGETGEYDVPPIEPPSDDEEVVEEETDVEEVEEEETDEEEEVEEEGGKGGHLPPEVEEEEVEEEEVEEEEVEEEEVVEEEVEEEDIEEEEVEVTDEEEGGAEGTSGKGGHLPPEVEETDVEEEEVDEEEGHLPPEEEEVVTDNEQGEQEEDEEEMFLIEIEDGESYYTNDPDGESGDIYECLEDDEIGEHIGTIKDGEISLF